MIAYHFAAAADNLTPADLDHALSMGWFRMRQAIFTTTHLNLEECHRVHWLRYALTEIRDHRSHRQIRKKNSSYRVEIQLLEEVHAEQEELYSRYRAGIDFGAGSIHESLFGDDLNQFNPYTTHCISIYDKHKLIAGGYFDTGEVSAASILHFYDPAYKRNSPGKYLILVTVDFLRSQGFQLYYPGYVIAGKRKMDYKLFLGKEAAKYFDPATNSWKYFDDGILVPEVLS